MSTAGYLRTTPRWSGFVRCSTQETQVRKEPALRTWCCFLREPEQTPRTSKGNATTGDSSNGSIPSWTSSSMGYRGWLTSNAASYWATAISDSSPPLPDTDGSDWMQSGSSGACAGSERPGPSKMRWSGSTAISEPVRSPHCSSSRSTPSLGIPN